MQATSELPMGILRFYNVLFAAILLVVATSSSVPRPRRRAPITSLAPITLQELEHACTVQGWTQCLAMVTSLLDINHPINTYTTECLANNNPFEPTPSPPPATPLTYSNIGNGITIENEGSGSTPTADPTSASNTTSRHATEESRRCLVNGEEKKRVRKEIYCRHLLDMDSALRSLIPYMCLLRDLNCVSYYSDPSYLSPHDVMESIRLWHEDMISTHKKCCEHQNEQPPMIFSRDLDDLYGNNVIRVGDSLEPVCPFFHPELLWDNGLTKVALLVHMLEMMQDLGRRRTCLRGCVNEGQVMCTNLLLYLI